MGNKLNKINKPTMLRLQLGKNEWVRYMRKINPRWSHKKATWEYFNGDK